VTGRTHAVIPYAHVADVARSIAFYERLGLEVVGTHEPDGVLAWAHLANGDARIMLARAGGEIEADDQAVLFYCWTDDVQAVAEEFGKRVTHPFYMPRGEVRLTDPDGYVVLVGEVERASK
jgi:catechol 2,3-dioxygenase-like lactoylglutathione lyase family enzyme